MPDIGAERRLAGIPVSAGIGYGRLCVTSIDESTDFMLSSLPRVYTARLNDALQATNNELMNLVNQCSSLGQDMFEAVHAHHLIMSDQNLQKWIGLNVMERCDDLETAINNYLEAYRNLLLSCLEQNLEDRDRLFKNLKQSLLRLLGNHRSRTFCRSTMGCELGECILQNKHIILCKELSAMSAILLDDMTCGVLVESDSVNIDASILLRGLQIPVVSGLGKHASEINQENEVLINGTDGIVVINPDQTTLDSFIPAH